MFIIILGFVTEHNVSYIIRKIEKAKDNCFPIGNRFVRSPEKN